MKTNKTLKTVALAGLMGSALLLTGCGGGGGGSAVSKETVRTYFNQVDVNNDGRVSRDEAEAAFATYLPSFYSAASDAQLLQAWGVIDANGDGYLTISEVNQVNENIDRYREIAEQIIDGDYGATAPVSQPYSSAFTSSQATGVRSFNIITDEGLVVSAQELSDAAVQAENLLSYSGPNITINADQNDFYDFILPLAHKEAVEDGYTNFTFTSNDIDAVFNEIIESNANDAWLLGWNGDGVTMSAPNSSNVDRQALIASTIAPGSTVLSAGSVNADIYIIDSAQVRFNKHNGAHVETFSSGQSGRYAGIGALVYHKFPSASDANVGAKVRASGGNALTALSPSM